MLTLLLGSIVTLGAMGAPDQATGRAPVPVPTPTALASQPATPPNDPCAGDNRLLATLNRPTIGFSACALPKGAIVLEEGYQSQTVAGSAGSVSVTYPQGFERFGIARRIELDLVGPNQNRLRSQTGLLTGASDYGLGFKFELPPAGRFTYAIDGLFTAATARQASGVAAPMQGLGTIAPTQSFGYGAPTQTLDADVAYALSPAIGVGATVAQGISGGFTSAGDRIRYGVFTPSVVVTAQLPKATQFYAELVGQTKSGPDSGGRTVTDFGVQQLLNPYVEFDLEYGLSFQPTADRIHYFGIGTGIRVR